MDRRKASRGNCDVDWLTEIETEEELGESLSQPHSLGLLIRSLEPGCGLRKNSTERDGPSSCLVQNRAADPSKARDSLLAEQATPAVRPGWDYRMGSLQSDPRENRRARHSARPGRACG